MSRAFLHVTTDRCPLRHCGWFGFHVHWRHHRFRSAFDGSMTTAELDQFDADCAADHAEVASR